jgi:hypothetical protein
MSNESLVNENRNNTERITVKTDKGLEFHFKTYEAMCEFDEMNWKTYMIVEYTLVFSNDFEDITCKGINASADFAALFDVDAADAADAFYSSNY